MEFCFGPPHSQHSQGSGSLDLADAGEAPVQQAPWASGARPLPITLHTGSGGAHPASVSSLPLRPQHSLRLQPALSPEGQAARPAGPSSRTAAFSSRATSCPAWSGSHPETWVSSSRPIRSIPNAVDLPPPPPPPTVCPASPSGSVLPCHSPAPRALPAAHSCHSDSCDGSAHSLAVFPSSPAPQPASQAANSPGL